MLENKEKDVKHSLPILFVSSEATPFAPNGDLAAKVTNLATRIAKQPENHFVAVVIPGYKQYMDEFKGQLKYIYSFQLPAPYSQAEIGTPSGRDCGRESGKPAQEEYSAPSPTGRRSS